MGPGSPHAVSFDIDWDLLPYRARGGVLFADHRFRLWAGAENGEIELRYDADEGSFSAWYFEHRLPIAPERYSEMLRMISSRPPPKTTPPASKSAPRRVQGLRHPNRKERRPSRRS